MRDFQQFDFWQRSHALTLKIYKLTNTFAKDELYGLTSQMRRSSASVPTNIAEGCGRNSTKEFKRFLEIAAGSSSELQYQLILTKDLDYINDLIFKELCDEIIYIRKMIYNYSEKIS